MAYDKRYSPLVRGTAKNGPQNTPLRGGKTQLLEGGIRVPFMVASPGILPADKVDNRPVVQLDILPTTLAAAGMELDGSWKLDGVNLLPFLTGQSAGFPHESLFWRHGESMGRASGDAEAGALARPEGQ